MTTHEAERDLQVIRTLMERGTRYTTLTASSGITAGLIALVGCAVQWLNPLGLEYRWNFVGTWSLVFIAAALANLYFTAQLARRNGEPTWSRPARTVVCALIPAFVAGVVLSTTLFRIGRIDLLPGTWMLLYGCGALAMSYFTPVVIRVLGIGFMAVGSVAVLLYPLFSGYEMLAMGASFGGMHLAYGIGLAVAGVHRSRPEQTTVARRR